MAHFLLSSKVNFSDLLFQYEFHAESGVFPGFAEIDFIKIHDQYLAGNFRRDALKALDFGLKYFPESSVLHAYKAMRLLESRKTKMALEMLSEAEFRGHCPVETSMIRAQIFTKQNKKNEALSLLTVLRKKSSISEDQWVHIGIAQSKILETEGREDEAFDILTTILHKIPNHVDALTAIQGLIENNRWYKDGIDFHIEFTDKDPYSWRAWYNLGHCYYGQCEYEKAIEAFEYCYLINKKFLQAYMDCAEVCQHLLKFRKALICYRDALEIYEPNEHMLFQIAECYLGLEKYEDAKKYYLRTLHTNGNNHEVFFKIGKTYEKQFSLKMAEKFYGKAWSMDNLREDYVEALASCYFKMGRHSKVGPLLEKVISMNPAEEHAWVMYAKFLILTGQFETATLLFKRAEEYTFSGKLLLCQAANSYLLGDSSRAFEILGEGLEEAYESIGLFFELVPHIRHDKKVKACLNYYDPEFFYK